MHIECAASAITLKNIILHVSLFGLFRFCAACWFCTTFSNMLLQICRGSSRDFEQKQPNLTLYTVLHFASVTFCRQILAFSVYVKILQLFLVSFGSVNDNSNTHTQNTNRENLLYFSMSNVQCSGGKVIFAQLHAFSFRYNSFRAILLNGIYEIPCISNNKQLVERRVGKKPELIRLRFERNGDES